MKHYQVSKDLKPHDNSRICHNSREPYRSMCQASREPHRNMCQTSRERGTKMLIFLLLTQVSAVSSDQLKGKTRRFGLDALTYTECYNHGPGMRNDGSRGIIFKSSKGNNYTFDILWQSFVKRPKCIRSLEMRVNGGTFQSLADPDPNHKAYYIHEAMPTCHLRLNSYKVKFRYEKKGKLTSFIVSGKHVNIVLSRQAALKNCA